jgi:hypothetical protein
MKSPMRHSIPLREPFRTALQDAGVNWQTYWITTGLFDFLWTGQFNGDNLKDVSGNGNDIVVTGKDFSTPYIPLTSSATFAIPNVAALKTDDEDLFWVNGSGVILQKTFTNLIEFDYTRTVIFYDSVAPYNVRGIGILKSGVTLTATQINRLHKDFKLWLYWSGTLNAYGVIKDNRNITSKPAITSVVIPDVNHKNVIITFDQNLNTSYVPDISAFSLSGKTIGSIVVLGNTVTLVATTQYAYGDTPTVSYTKPVVNALRDASFGTKTDSFTNTAITNNIFNIDGLLTDGNSFGEYDAFNLATVTKNGSDIVSRWNDVRGSGHDFTTANSKWDATEGMTHNGTNQYMQTGSGGYVQPEVMYFAIKVKSWTIDDNIINGLVANSGSLTQSGTTPNVLATAGSGGKTSGDIPLNSWCLLELSFVSGRALVKVNEIASADASCGTNNMDGITIARYPSSGIRFGDVNLKGFVARKIQDNAANKLGIRNYIYNKYLL